MFKKIMRYLCLFNFVLLSSCSQAINTANAGNVHHYRAHGKHYKVLHSSKNYQANGLASWYGPTFHKKRTSSGERYNMYQLTAAHKTLPLDTYVQVTNLTNGKRVIVKINDRGPFARNRLIDLSYAAAKKLGMVGHGTTFVSIKTVTTSYSI